MLQESRQNGNEGEVSKLVTDIGSGTSNEGFEGMNYEQVRQPYNPRYKGRNNNTDERQFSTRPDES